MDRNLTKYFGMLRSRKSRVWFPGSTQVRKGMGVCYDLDIYTAKDGQAVTDGWGRRGNSVAVPDTSNNLAFAGVATQTYLAKSGGQFIDIYEPGGMAEVAVGLPTTINETILTCSVNTADAGRFTLQGLPGRGTALALQSQARADGGNIAFSSLDGTATSVWTTVSTISKAGIGTACGHGDDDIDPTEFVVVVLGGADEATGGDSAGEMATKGAYAVLDAPTSGTITIATDIGDVDATLYVIKNTYTTVMCYLMDGDESGLQETISPQDDTTSSLMVGGSTFLCSGYALQADAAGTLADGLRNGQRKMFGSLGTFTSNDWVLTCTGGIDVDLGNCVTIPFDTAGDYLVMEWHGLFTGGSNAHWQATSWGNVTIAG